MRWEEEIRIGNRREDRSDGEGRRVEEWKGRWIDKYPDGI
jgi:hypothetical protein